MKVLLFSNDLMPFGKLPTSGGGLRCFQLMRGLEAHGVEVIASMPGFTYLAEKHFNDIPEQQRELLWRWETQDDILQRTKPDAVLFASNWDHFNLTRPFDVPLIVDLHGSRLIETTMWNNPVSTDKKVHVLGRADCLLCAGVRQRSYFYGWLVQAGRVPDDEHFIRYIPISLGPDMPEHIFPEINDPEAPRFVSGGGWFPWQNQSKAIFSICKNVAERSHGTIDIFGTPHETQQLSAEEQVIRDIYLQVKELSTKSSRIRVNGYIGREELVQIYQRASVAVEVMQYNIERELAFTTRTIEYLWCGLPVMYNNYAEISGHIRDYDAGWTVDPTSDEEIQSAIDEILTRPDVVRRKSENAQRLVRDRFTWDQTILPLLDFLKHPRKVAVVEPAVGTICAQPSFLSPRGSTVEVNVPLRSGAPLRQKFTVPAENISCLQIHLNVSRPEARSSIAKLQMSITNERGRVVARTAIKGEMLPNSGFVELRFPRLRRPKGGEKLTFELFAVGKDGQFESNASSVLTVPGLLSFSYPFLKGEGEACVGTSLLGESVPVGALALHFVPGGSRIYRLKLIGSRILELVRKGEWSRLFRAVRHRLPQAARTFRLIVSSRMIF